MKKLLLFLTIVIVTLFQCNRLLESKANLKLEGCISGQAFMQKKLMDYNNGNSTLVKNKGKMAHSYNPPKMIMGISIIFFILFFVISKNFYAEKIIEEVISA